jgi:hypothetical protein
MTNAKCVTRVTSHPGTPIYPGGIIVPNGNTGAAAMDAMSDTKSPALNRLEGMTLTALLQALPTYAGAAILLKLFGSQAIGHVGGAALFVMLTTFFHALITPWLAPKFPKFFKNSYEPLFFDAGLSFAEKVMRWRTQPMASLQLLANMVMLSLLGVAVLSVG